MTEISNEEIRRAAFNTLKQLFRAMKEDGNFGFVISAGDEDYLISQTVQHHGEHLKLHALRQRHVDGYKLLAWLGCNLLDLVKENAEITDVDFHFKECARILVNLMAGFLQNDHGIEIPITTRRMMALSLYQERFNNSEHGIWMNGLFLSFHSAVRACELKEQ